MRTEQLTTGRFRVYPPDAIPLWALSSKRVLSQIGKTFGFEQFQLAQSEGDQGPPSLLFGRGRLPSADPALPATIESLRISHDHLDLTTRAPQGHGFSDALLVEIGRVCSEADPTRAAWLDAFRIEIFQTVWVGRLEVIPEDMIDPRARAVLVSALSAENGQGSRHASARGLSMRVTTRVPKPELLELGGQLADDEFKLEPRAGRLPSEQAWFSASPLRSEDHLRLLEELERAYRG